MFTTAVGLSFLLSLQFCTGLPLCTFYVFQEVGKLFSPVLQKSPVTFSQQLTSDAKTQSFRSSSFVACKRWGSFYDLPLEEQILQWERWYYGCDCIAMVQQEWRQWQLPAGLQVMVGFGVSPWKSVSGHRLSWLSCWSAINVFNLPSPISHSVSLYPCKPGLRNSFVEVCLSALQLALFSSGERAARAGWTLIRHCMGWWSSSSLEKKQQKNRQSSAKNHRFFGFLGERRMSFIANSQVGNKSWSKGRPVYLYQPGKWWISLLRLLPQASCQKASGLYSLQTHTVPKPEMCRKLMHCDQLKARKHDLVLHKNQWIKELWLLDALEVWAAPAVQCEPKEHQRVIRSNMDLTCIYGRKVSWNLCLKLEFA